MNDGIQKVAACLLHSVALDRAKIESGIEVTAIAKGELNVGRAFCVLVPLPGDAFPSEPITDFRFILDRNYGEGSSRAFGNFDDEISGVRLAMIERNGPLGANLEVASTFAWIRKGKTSTKEDGEGCGSRRWDLEQAALGIPQKKDEQFFLW